MTASMKLQAFITPFKQMENKKYFFASPRFIVLCQMGERRRETGSVIPQVQAKHFASNASCFHQKIVLSPEVASATGKMAHSEWWLMRAVKTTGMLP